MLAEPDGVCAVGNRKVVDLVHGDVAKLQHGRVLGAVDSQFLEVLLQQGLGVGFVEFDRHLLVVGHHLGGGLARFVHQGLELLLELEATSGVFRMAASLLDGCHQLRLVHLGHTRHRLEEERSRHGATWRGTGCCHWLEILTTVSQEVEDF